MAHKEVDIRRLVDRDIDAVVTIEQEVFGAEAWSRELVAEEIASPWSFYCGAFVDEALVGYGGIKGDLEKDLMTLGVLSQCQGLGIGRQILRTLVMEAAGADIFLEVRASNTVAIALYSSFGFYPIGKIKDYYRQPREDAVSMKLSKDNDRLSKT
ncbi:ribosomal-protein-alanine N-acetyltransferase [Actinomycetaceae bacterium WB03_NA08]|uniref:[Ribosomal protein bS18]-alanine N-acetyltransferase n=1 Tax=Scrofimicrobium canadense TaxID=2652290 RepID=A0A6N7W6A6_9ACTO|nr:ribosomal protein S18-alanine N-acetyltransferase [Scrofimicrobium canadense]MSS83766.1 ribosomal-protein-alanine N-acetyltransferase [Scrofimicrobium canadense]